MRLARWSARLAVVAVLLVGTLAWGQPGGRADGVLGRWTGTFVWDDEPDRVQRVEIEFTAEASGPGGSRRFIGPGVYRTERVTRFEATLDYDPRSREIRLSEGEADEPGWVNDGVHVGTLSPDGSRIEARWVSKSDGHQGRLVLTRADRGGK